MNLPPLRTVRDPAAASDASKTPTLVPGKPIPGLGANLPAARPTIQIDAPGLPKPARDFLSELVGLHLLPEEAIPEFVQKVGTRAAQLNSRERTADALNGLGFLRAFVTSRILSNQLHGLVYGSYRVLDRLGSGSIGIVFLGEHVRLRRKVAIKTMPVDDTVPPAIVKRFEQEARLLASLDHAGIVQVYDIDRLPGGGPGLPEMLYQVQEFVPGGDLENYIYAQGQQPIPTVCEWGRQIAGALKACHSAGLIHRDLKPSNLVLTATKRLKLIDFGLARDFASVQTPSKTLLGSLEFLAPEQVVEPATAGAAADVYSLGATLFWLFTGQLPYPQTNNQREALENIRTKLPLRGREARPDLPKELDQLLARMLARNPAERPSLNEVQHALQAEAAHSAVFNQLHSAAHSSDENAANRETVRHLEDELIATQTQLAQARLAFSTATAALAAACPGETSEHQQRLARGVRLLAPHLATQPAWPMMADPRIVEDYARAIAAHDFGVIALGLGASKMEIHTARGDEILANCAKDGGNALPQLRLLRSAVRHHHEAWNGSGYPDGLREEHIPAVARLAAVLISYDDARRGADGQPRQKHSDAVRSIVSRSGVIFDPQVVQAFHACEAELDRHFWEVLEPGMQPPVQSESGVRPGLPSVPPRRWGNMEKK